MLPIVKIELQKISDHSKATLKIVGPRGESASSEISLLWIADFEWRAVSEALTLNSSFEFSDQVKEKAQSLGLCDEQGKPLRNRLETIGRKLYEMLSVNEEVRNTLNSLLTTSPSILRFHIPDEGSILQAYPWELLHNGQRFLFFSQHYIARWIEFAEPVGDIASQVSLNVLLIDPRPDSMPKGFQKLPRNERAYLAALGRDYPRKFYSFRSLEDQNATLGELNKVLSDTTKDVNVIHIDTHGSYGWLCTCSYLNNSHASQCLNCQTKRSSTQYVQGYLLFRGKDGICEWVNGNDLGRQLEGKNVSLILLSACQSGLVAGSSSFNSIVGALTRHGIPAVIGFQTRISTDESKLFSERFYGAILSNRSLIDAISLARQSLHAYQPDSSWFRPVLYWRSFDQNSDGKIWSFPDATKEHLKTNQQLHPNPHRHYWLKNVHAFSLDPFKNPRGSEDENISNYYFPVERFYEVLKERHPFVVLGESGTGKSSFRQAICQTILREDEGLPIVYDDFRVLSEKINLSFDDYIGELLTKFFNDLRLFVQTNGPTIKIEPDSRNRLWLYIVRYLKEF